MDSHDFVFIQFEYAQRNSEQHLLTITAKKKGRMVRTMASTLPAAAPTY